MSFDDKVRTAQQREAEEAVKRDAEAKRLADIEAARELQADEERLQVALSEFVRRM